MTHLRTAIVPFCLSIATFLVDNAAAQAVPCFDTSPNDVYINARIDGGRVFALKHTNGAMPLTVTVMEMFTRSAGPQHTCTLSLWSHDAASDAPMALLGQSTFLLSPGPDWQGTTLPAPVAIGADEIFWISMESNSGLLASLEFFQIGVGQVYRSSVDGGQNWGPPGQEGNHKFRLYCGDKTPGAYHLLGQSCSVEIGDDEYGPRSFGQVPTIGESMPLGVLDNASNASVFLGIAFSTLAPIDLTVIGADGCQLYLDPSVTVSLTTDANGVANFALPLAADASLVGAEFFTQWFELVPGVNPLGLLTSAYGRATIGN